MALTKTQKNALISELEETLRQHRNKLEHEARIHRCKASTVLKPLQAAFAEAKELAEAQFATETALMKRKHAAAYAALHIRQDKERKALAKKITALYEKEAAAFDKAEKEFKKEQLRLEEHGSWAKSSSLIKEFITQVEFIDSAENPFEIIQKFLTARGF